MTFPAASAIHRGLGRFEVFDMAPERLPALAVHALCSPWPFSVHTPLSRPAPARNPSAVFFLADSPERERGFAEMDRTLREAAALHAEYVVTHLNWTEDVPEEARAEALAHDAGARLTALSRAHGIAVHLECGGYSGGFHRAEQFARLARTFPELGLCLDVGHLWLIAQARDRSAYREIEILAPHARSLHLWAARDLETYRRGGHLPLSPARSGADGWLDLERAVTPILGARPDCAAIFEFTWDPGEDAQVTEGLRWAEDFLGALGQSSVIGSAEVRPRAAR